MKILIMFLAIFGMIIIQPLSYDVSAQLMSDEMNMPMDEMIQEEKHLMMAPKKQINQNIDPHMVMCNSGLELVLKATDFSPACVKPETAIKLKERGWASKHEVTHDIMSMKK